MVNIKVAYRSGRRSGWKLEPPSSLDAHSNGKRTVNDRHTWCLCENEKDVLLRQMHWVRETQLVCIPAHHARFINEESQILIFGMHVLQKLSYLDTVRAQKTGIVFRLRKRRGESKAGEKVLIRAVWLLIKTHKHACVMFETVEWDILLMPQRQRTFLSTAQNFEANTKNVHGQQASKSKKDQPKWIQM